MPTAIALVRGINVGGKNILPMESLRSLCADVGMEDAKTYIQSGNIVFRADRSALAGSASLVERLEKAIEKARGFRPRVVVRTLVEWSAIIDASPFSGRKGVEPNKLLVFVLDGRPSAAAAKSLASVNRGAEEPVLIGRELFVYFPDGAGKSKLSMPAVERALGVAGTGRNWNTVLKLREMGTELEAT